MPSIMSSMTSWEVRAAVESDLSELAQIEAACFSAPWSPSLLRQAMRDPKYVLLCAATSERIVGHAIGWSVWDEAQVDRLGVLLSRRKQGIGRALLDALAQRLELAGARSLFLEVRASNRAAIALYQSAGFDAAGLRRAYYEDGEDAVILRRDLGATSTF